MKDLRLLFSPHIIAVLLLFAVFNYLSSFLPTRKAVLDYFGPDRNYLASIEIAVVLLGLTIHVLFYGWLTHLIVGAIRHQKIHFLESVRQIKFWYFRSLIAVLIGWGGIISISFVVGSIASDPFFSFLGIFLNGMWITLTYTFFPVVIASQSSILKAIGEAVSISIKTVPRWFHMLLLVFIISGGFVYIWIPEQIAEQYLNKPGALHGWMVHLQWLGGYSFKSFWLWDYARTLLVHPSGVLLAAIFFFNALVATLVKIKVTRILFNNGYIDDGPDSPAKL